jgi:hypothetical protein
VQSVRRDRVDRAIGAEALRLVDVEDDAPFDRRAPGDQRLAAEILLRQHLEIVQRAGHDGGDDDGVDLAAVIAFEREQLAEPDGIFVRGAARIGGDAPARLDRPPLDQCEDDIGIAGIHREQHRQSFRTKTSAA